MKKRIVETLFLILLSTFFTTKIKALELDANGYYLNNNGIRISGEELNNLKNMGFTDREIIGMQQDEFYDNRNLKGEIVAQTTKYYKTTTIYNATDAYMNLNVLSPRTTTIEISLDEYESENNIQDIVILGNSNGYTETNYKKMTTSIIKNGNYYRFKNDLVWKKMPSTRSYDLQGIGIDSTVSGVNTSAVFKSVATIDDLTNSSCYLETNTTCTWKKRPTGYALSFKLPSDGITKKVIGLSSHMYFDVQKLTNTTIKTLNAYGDYKHAQKSVSTTVNNSFSIVTGGISFDIGVSSSIVESYDSMSTAQATWSGLSW